MKTEVLLVVTNAEHLAEHLTSLAEQTTTDFLLRVFPNGLGERETSAIALELERHPGLTYELLPRSPSVQTETMCLTQMLADSKAEWVIPAQPQDKWSKHKVKFLSELMEKNPALAASGTECQLIDEKGKISGGWFWVGANQKEVEEWCRMQKPVMYHPACVVRTAALRKVGGWDVTLECCFDTDLWIRMVKAQMLVQGIPGSETRYTDFRRTGDRYTEGRKKLMAERDIIKARYKDNWPAFPSYKPQMDPSKW